MKQRKALKLEALSVRQKLGIAMTQAVRLTLQDVDPVENFEHILELIREHALGSVWVALEHPRRQEVLQRIHETADYPILVLTDTENGLDDHLIGKHNAIGMTDREDLAYAFGKVTAINARKQGYNVLCCPLLDMINEWGACGTNCRALGSNRERVAKLAAAEARGLHDGGVLTVGKHYPGGNNPDRIDSHMGEVCCAMTKEELLDYSLYPYLQLMKEELLDGIMVGHHRYINIDPDYPATLSKPVVDIIREQGFDGFAITDALIMNGVKAKFGESRAKGLSFAAGNDLLLPWTSAKASLQQFQDCYDAGMFSDERLDEAVRRVLAAQQKILDMEPKYTEVTDEDIALFDLINRDSVYAQADKGLEIPISRDGRHFFAMMVKNGTAITPDGQIAVDTFSTDWYFPNRITATIQRLFPNSKVCAIDQFPNPGQNQRVLDGCQEYEDVVFITFGDAPANAGSDAITQRLMSVIQALQITKRISTVVHFGNPFVLEDMPHIPRYIIGGTSADNIDAALEVLAGEYPAKGVMTYDVKLP